VLLKNHAQEFEADDIGYRLTLGVADSEDFDLAMIDAGESCNLDAWRACLRHKSLIAAPFVPLTIDAILAKFGDAARLAGNRPTFAGHPSAVRRAHRTLLVRHPGKGPVRLHQRALYALSIG
jgi:hypothetical protein